MHLGFTTSKWNSEFALLGIFKLIKWFLVKKIRILGKLCNKVNWTFLSIQSDTNGCELLFLCLELVKVSLAWVQKADCCASVVVDLSVFYFTLQGFSSKLCYVASLDCLRGKCVVSVPICVAINVSYWMGVEFI